MSRRITFAPDLLTLLLKGLTIKLLFFIRLIEFSYLYTIEYKVLQTWKYIKTNKINSPRNWHIYFNICISLSQTR